MDSALVLRNDSPPRELPSFKSAEDAVMASLPVRMKRLSKNWAFRSILWMVVAGSTLLCRSTESAAQELLPPGRGKQVQENTPTATSSREAGVGPSFKPTEFTILPSQIFQR
jgi:hypothetical protein